MKIPLLLFLISVFFISSASALSLADPCDTLFTKDGKHYLVKIHKAHLTGVEFSLCGDTTAERFNLSSDKVDRIAIYDEKAESKKTFEKDPLTRQAKRALSLSIIGTAIFSLLPVAGFAGIILFAIATVKGERTLRRLRKVPDHPNKDNIRKQARSAIILSMLMILIPIALFLLVLLLL